MEQKIWSYFLTQISGLVVVKSVSLAKLWGLSKNAIKTKQNLSQFPNLNFGILVVLTFYSECGWKLSCDLEHRQV